MIEHVYARKEAFAVELRLVLPPPLLAHLDWASLERRSTERTDERLRGRISDLHFSIDYVIVCAGEIWLEHLRDNPKATTFPVILPIFIA